MSRAAGASAEVSTSEAMESFLTANIHDSLNMYLHSNAIFLAERLYAANASEVRATRGPRGTASQVATEHER